MPNFTCDIEANSNRENRIEKYRAFCESNFVPIYSKIWWLDAVCGEENWDVWLYESGGIVLAAMPYYMEKRGDYKYITKAPLTQNNGIIFGTNTDRKRIAEAKFQEKVIDVATEFIQSMGLDVYEQQYQHSFTNWSPFSWRNYTCLLRYTYVIEDTSNMDVVWNNFASECRQNIKKGQRLTYVTNEIDKDTFYYEHEKVFLRQGLRCPFSKEFWDRLYSECKKNDSCELLCAKDYDGNINSVLFLVWDEKFMYHLLGGSMPEFSSNQSYYALTYYGIRTAHDKNLSYDFEGSMIQRIARAFRSFGGIPMPYYRIRKVFNPKIVRMEAEDYIEKLKSLL